MDDLSKSGYEYVAFVWAPKTATEPNQKVLSRMMSDGGAERFEELEKSLCLKNDWIYTYLGRKTELENLENQAAEISESVKNSESSSN
jgi:hypothetical protein